MLAEAWWRGDRSENAAVESTQPVKEIELWRNPNKPVSLNSLLVNIPPD